MPRHLLSTPTILASSTLVLWKALQAHGYDANDIFIKAGLDPATLKDEEACFAAKSVTPLKVSNFIGYVGKIPVNYSEMNNLQGRLCRTTSLI